jgi:two-component system sensor histidine kinase/response regulator
MSPKLSIRSRLVVSFAFAAAGVIGLALVSYRATARSLEASRSVARTQEVISALEETLGLIESVETAQRAYMITGQPGYRREAKAGQSLIARSMAHLDQLLMDHPRQSGRAGELHTAVARKITDVNQLLHLREVSGFESARDQLAAGVGKNSMDAVRAVIATMKQREVQLLETRARQSDAEARWNIRALGIGMAADVFLLLTILALILRDLRRRSEMAEALAGARDEAIRTAEARWAFLSRMSHQVRTPLNAVLGFNGLLLASPHLPPREREFAESVRDSGDLLLAIVDEILDVSKIESGQLLIEPVDFDLRETVDSVVQMFGERAHAKGLEIGLLWDHILPETVRGDAARIRQVLMNLVSNAVKFTESGDVIVSVNSESRLSAVRFSVTDTGAGFTRSGQITQSNAGTGLGLAIAENLIRLLGGALTIESEAGKGSTLWFSIPLGEPAGAAQGQTTSRDTTALTGLRVLVVDDARASRQTIRHDLAAWKIDSDEAASAKEALSALRRAAAAGRRYDLALIDSVMPDMDGVVLSRLIKADSAIASTRIVLLTSLSECLEPNATRSAGIDATITKPPRQSSLFDAIVDAISGRAFAKQRKTSPSRSRPARPEVRMLIVEDNSVNQRLAVLQLDSLGLHADTAADGVEALEAMARIPYHLVFMDCQMPVMNGFDATRELRRREGSGLHVPVIAMTANAVGSDRQRCLDAGMDDYISKPVNIDQLALMVDRWLPAPDEESLDQTVLASLKKLAAADPQVIPDLVSLYAADSAALILEIQKAVDEGNQAALSTAAHTLKSCSGSIGAKKVRAIAASLEALGATAPAGDARPFVERLRDEHSRAMVKLQAFAASNAESPLPVTNPTGALHVHEAV